MTNHSSSELPFPNKCFFVEVLFDYRGKTIVATVITMILNSVTFPVAVIGNLAIIIAIFRTPSLQNPSNFLICSLAFADFTISLLCQPLRVICKVFEVVHNFNSYCVCFVASGAIAWVASAVSCFVLGMIALERFLALHFHLRYYQLITIKKLSVPVTLLWVFSIALTISRYATRGYFSFEKVYIVLLCSNFVIIFVAYAKIYRIVKRHRCQIKTQQRSLDSTTCHSLREISDVDPHTQRQRKISLGQLMIQELASGIKVRDHYQPTNQIKESMSDDGCDNKESRLTSVNQYQTSNQQPELMPVEYSRAINQQLEAKENKCQSSGGYQSNITVMSSSSESHPVSINEQNSTMQQVTSNRIQLARYRKSTFTMILILGLFILAYFPTIIIHTVKSLIGFKCYSVKVALEVSTTFLYMNAAINPVMYYLRMESLRRACMKLLPWTRKKRKIGDPVQVKKSRIL